MHGDFKICQSSLRASEGPLIVFGRKNMSLSSCNKLPSSPVQTSVKQFSSPDLRTSPWGAAAAVGSGGQAFAPPTSSAPCNSLNTQTQHDWTNTHNNYAIILENYWMVLTTILLHGWPCRKCQRHAVVIFILAWYFDVKLNSKTTRGSGIDEKVSGFKETPASFQTNMGLIHLLPLAICAWQCISFDHMTIMWKSHDPPYRGSCTPPSSLWWGWHWVTH